MDFGHYRAIIARRMEQGIAESIKLGDKARIRSSFRPAHVVMPGLVPGIHDFRSRRKTWMAGTSPATTERELLRRRR